jgi:hypothetical protein
MLLMLVSYTYSAVIRALSNYEMATDIAPVDVGTTAAFVSRVPGLQ